MGELWIGLFSPVGEEFAALGEDALLFPVWEVEDSAGFSGEFGDRELVGVAEVLFPLRVAEGVPAAGGDPVDAGHVGGGDEAVLLQEFVEEIRPGSEGDEGAAVPIEVEEREHLAADGLVSDPEDKVVAPLLGFDDVREMEEEGAGSLGVHAGECSASRPGLLANGYRRKLYFRWPLSFEAAAAF